MKVPIFWLKDYVKVPKDLSILTNRLTMAGHLLDSLEKIENEPVIDLELRGNRADCYSILGIAREISALFKTPVKYPAIYKKLKKVPQLPDCVNNIKTTHVKRVMMVKIKNVTICKSPDFISKRLNAYGIPAINNIVDLTNYVMIETGEPMHAFDLDMLGGSIEIRLAKSGERMITFLDQTLNLTSDDLVWANAKSILSIAGAIGGKHRSINPATKNVLLEAANYNRANIRRSIYRHNLLTDAGIRHEKELDPNLVDYAIYRYLQLIKENGWGIIEPKVFDYYPFYKKPWFIDLRYAKFLNLTGVKIPLKKIKDILARLNFIIVKQNPKGLRVKIPTYRTDVTIEEDLVEEILRIYGYENISSEILNLSIPEEVTPSFIHQEMQIKNQLSSFGFNETISLSFAKEGLSNLNFNFEDTKSLLVKVVNAPSPDSKNLRISLLPNLYETAKKATYERAEEIRYFEVGKIYFKKNSEYFEKRKLGIIYWEKNRKDTSLIFKGFIEGLFKKINLENTAYKQTLEAPNLQEAYQIIIDKSIIGIAGRYEDFYYCEIDLEAILNKIKKPKISLWPKYPPQVEDLTLLLPDKTYLGNIIGLIQTEKFINKVELISKYKNSYTFQVFYQNPTKTFTDKEVTTIRKKILTKLKLKYGVMQKN